MNPELFLDNSMARQSLLSPGFAEVVLNSITEQKLADALPIKEIYDAQQVIITGCGDSWMAGIAAKPFFEKYLHRETKVLRCVDFSRYYSSKSLGYSPNTPLVIAISFSGSAARVVEAMKRASKYGANTLLITGNENSAAAKEARHVLKISYPDGEYQPGLNSYIGSVTTLILLALRMAYVRDNINKAQYDRIKETINAYCQSYDACVKSWNVQLREKAKSWAELDCYDFIADGADFATALFGSAKVVECFGGRSTFDDSEDWCHINYFMRNPEKIGRVMICNRENPAFSRAKETLHAIAQLQSPCIVVTDASPDEFPETALVLQTPHCELPWLNPLMQHIPLAILAGHIQVIKGIEPFRSGNPTFAKADEKLKGTTCGIKTSQIVIV